MRYRAISSETRYQRQVLVFGTYTYLPGKYNQLNKTVTGSTTWFYNYDRNGNQIWKNRTGYKTNFQFNALDQLTMFVNNSQAVGQYWYDANGARVKVVEGSTTTKYVYLGHDPISDKSGRNRTDYGYIGVALKFKLVGATGAYVYYYFNDALGSPRLVMNGSDLAYLPSTYKPFGTPYGILYGSDGIGYAGELQDSSPGLYYIGARWMDPDTGRWLSLDPVLGRLSFPQTMNRYAYCVNNPLRFVDPAGEGFWSGIHHWWDKHWKEVAIAALCVAAVLTAGIAAPALFGLIGVEVSVSASVATAFLGGSINAAFTYFSSGGKASFGDIMGLFVAGGVTSAFLPGLARTPTAFAAIQETSLLSGRLVAGGMGSVSGFLGNIAGQVTHNAANGGPLLSVDMSSAFAQGALTGVLSGAFPGSVDFAKTFIGEGGKGVFSSFLERAVAINSRGGLGALLNPLAHPCGAYFWGSSIISIELGLIAEKGAGTSRFL